MSDKYLTSFVDELPRMDDDSLLRTLVRFNAAPGEYRPEAISVARAEMERRGLAAAQLSEAVGHVVREAVESVFDDAVRLAEDGRTIAQIQTHLKARGLNDLSAAEMARRAWEMPTEQRNRAGQRNMISGAALCFVGLLPTAATYFVAASSAGGGRYALFWGMVLGGLLQFLRGVRPGQSLANTLLRKKNPPCPSEIEEPRMSACAPRPLQKRCSGSWAYPAG